MVKVVGTRVRLLTLVVGLMAASCSHADGPDTTPQTPHLRSVSVGAHWGILYPAVSPDGSKLAFLAQGPTHTPRVGVISLVDSSEAVPVTPVDTRVAAFAWMPNSRELLIGSGPAAGPTELSMVDLRGRIVREVPAGEQFRIGMQGLAVAPDGRSAAAAVRDVGPFDGPGWIVTIDLRSGDVGKLYDGDGRQWFESLHFAGAQDLLMTEGHLVFEQAPDARGVMLDLGNRSATPLTPSGRIVTGIAPAGDGSFVYTWFSADRSAGSLEFVTAGGSGTTLYEAADLRGPSVSEGTVYFMSGTGSTVSVLDLPTS